MMDGDRQSLGGRSVLHGQALGAEAQRPPDLLIRPQEEREKPQDMEEQSWFVLMMKKKRRKKSRKKRERRSGEGVERLTSIPRKN
jgi:hypothetical protein